MKTLFTIIVLTASVMTTLALPEALVERDGVLFDKRQCGCSGGLLCCIAGD